MSKSVRTPFQPAQTKIASVNEPRTFYTHRGIDSLQFQILAVGAYVTPRSLKTPLNRDEGRRLSTQQRPPAVQERFPDVFGFISVLKDAPPSPLAPLQILHSYRVAQYQEPPLYFWPCLFFQHVSDLCNIDLKYSS